MTKAFEALHQTPCLLGGIEELSVIRQIQELQGSCPCIMTLGFPCQPLSRQGDQRGAQDARLSALPAALYAAHLLQCWMIVLENVPEARNSTEIQDLLRSYAESHGMVFIQGSLQLQQIWPCRRHRWFGVLLPVEFGHLQIRDLPALAIRPTLQDVLPPLPCWPLHEEDILRWNDYECSMYLNENITQGPRFLEDMLLLPTPLHSWGVALQACPCSCRAAPLSEERIFRQGLRGVGVRSAYPEAFARHMHPAELQLLLGIPAFAPRFAGPREALCLLGNAVSPIQVIWLFADLIDQGLDIGNGAFDSAQHVLRSYLNMLLRQRMISWPRGDFLRDPEGHSCWIQDEHGIRSILFAGGATIGSLIRAELAFHSPGTILKVSVDGIIVPDHVLLQCIHYQLEIVRKRKAKSLDRDLIIRIEYDGKEQYHQVPWASTLLQVLPWIGLSTACHCLNLRSDKTWPLDEKILQSSSFRLTEWHRAQGFAEDAQEEAPDLFTQREWLESLPADFATLVQSVADALDGHDVQSQELASIEGTGLDSVTMTIAAQAIAALTAPERQLHLWLLDPALAKDFVNADPEVARSAIGKHLSQEGIEEVLVVCAFQKHWTTIRLTWYESTLTCQIADARANDLMEDLVKLLRLFQLAVGAEQMTFGRANLLLQQADTSCGALALVHLGYLLELVTEITYLQMKEWYAALRWRSMEPFRADGTEVEDLKQWLLDFLPEKGVPADRVAHRVQEAVKCLPIDQLQKAKSSGNPWKILKGLTDRRGRVFRWVQPNELQTFIDAQANAKFGLSAQKKPTADKQAPKETTPLQSVLDAHSLQLKEGFFVDEAGTDVPQISLDGIQANARGIALANAVDVKAWLQAGKSISMDALAVLTTSVIPVDLQSCLPHSVVRYACLVLPTNEPALLTGSLLQLGDDQISKCASQGVSILACPTVTFKVHVFRDLWPVSWVDLTRRPVAQIVEHCALLQVCPGQACGANCVKWHKDLDGQTDSPLLDLWNFFWQKKEGGKEKAAEAALFTVLIRVPADMNTKLQAFSGRDGMFFEPRSSNGREASDLYRVIWLPKYSKDEAEVELRSQEMALALCRLKDKYGLRVKKDEEGALFSALFPSKMFVACQPTDVYVMEPVPIGTQKYGVQKLLKEIGWAAKPMQPKGSAAGGIAWQVAAQSPPPDSVISTKEGEIIVTWVRSLQPKRKDTDATVMSLTTRQRLQKTPSSASGTSDPWLNGDPWQSFRPTTPAVPTVMMHAGDAASSKYEAIQTQLKAQVEHEVKGHLNKASDTSLMQQRMDRMEVDLQELKHQGQQFHDWFKQSAEHQRQAANSIEDLQQTSKEQSTCLAAIAANLEASNKEVQEQQLERQSIRQSLHELCTKVQADLQAQTTRIEKMMGTKLQRRE